jgi:hypothetical protein
MIRLRQAIAVASLGVVATAGLSASAHAGNGFFTGLAVGAVAGAAVAGATSRPAYSNDYVEPTNGPSAYDQRRCWWEHKQLYDQWGNPAGSQTVKTCRR